MDRNRSLLLIEGQTKIVDGTQTEICTGNGKALSAESPAGLCEARGLRDTGEGSRNGHHEKKNRRFGLENLL
jgi:hypothetical protein